jgi:hypothetical protein
MRSIRAIVSLLLLLPACSGAPPRAESALPALAAEGWTADKNGHASWFKGDWQIADFNEDGKIDYVRFPDPPGSYNHRIWKDQNCDGRFDTYSSNQTGGKTIRVDFPAPDFAPALQRAQARRKN